MPRTVVPPQAPSRPQAGGSSNPDRIPEKIAKYVPAETLAFFVPAAAMIGSDNDSLLVVALIAGLLGTPGYLYLQAQRTSAAERPLWHFYVLAVIAFACWALAATSAVADLLGVSQSAAGVVLLIAVFLIPLADSVLNHLQGRPRPSR